MAWGVHGRGGMHGWGTYVAEEMATAADGMHPTGMHSCLAFLFAMLLMIVLSNHTILF